MQNPNCVCIKIHVHHRNDNHIILYTLDLTCNFVQVTELNAVLAYVQVKPWKKWRSGGGDRAELERQKHGSMLYTYACMGMLVRRLGSIEHA